jgi:hypothetical protein
VKLGTLLLRNAAIGLSQLEGALRNQVLYGGRLGTNLVELGHLDLEQLSAYLAELSGFAVATPTLLDGADPKLMERLGSDDAHRLRAIPLGYLGEGGTVAVAFVDPRDTAAIEHVAARLGTPVVPYIVPELRALYYLEKHFGLPRRARFLRPGRPDSEPAAAAERRSSTPAQGLALPPSFTLEPRRRRPASQTAPAPLVPVTVTFEAACQRIDTAPHRERIADVFAEYARGRCDALVIFLIRDGNAFGWRGYVAPPVTPKSPVEELSLPLGGVSSLQSAHDAGQPFPGPPPATAHPTETRLWAALGSGEPAGVVVVPILVKQRVVNLVYAHALAGPPPPELATELTELAARAQNAYLRLIRQARGS